MDVPAAVVATVVATIWQAEGVVMEVLHVDAAEALRRLLLTAARRREPLEDVAADVVARRTIFDRHDSN